MNMVDGIIVALILAIIFGEYAGFDYSQFEQVYPDKNCQFCFLTSYIETE